VSLPRLSTAAAALTSGLLLAGALPLVLTPVSLRQLDPAGHLEALAWVALVPAFLALRRSASARRAAGLGLATGLVYFFAAIHWVSHAMTAFGGLPLALSLLALTLLVLFMAAHWALVFGAAAWVRLRTGWPLCAHLPPLWVGGELLRNHLFSGFPWADVGYTQARTLPVAQLAALTGVYGIAALVVLVNAALAEALAAWRARAPLPIGPVAGALALVGAVAGYGALHLRAVRAAVRAAPTLQVGVVQPNIDQSTKNTRLQHADYILSRLVPPTVEADRRGADLVVWPEAAYPYEVPPDLRSLDVEGAGVPRLSHAHVLLGAPTLRWERSEEGQRVPVVGNAQFLLAPDLRVLGAYQKLHLVPFGEYVPEAVRVLLPFVKQLVPGMTAAHPGRSATVLSFEPTRAERAGDPPGADGTGAAAGQPRPVRLAPLICYDAIFPEIPRAFLRQEPPPDLLVNPTNDAWYGYSSGPYQFLAIVQLRAIEAGRAVVRPAYAGVSAIILPTGELAPGALEVGPVDADLAPPDEPPRLLLADVPLVRGETVYTRVGDLFAYACALAGVAAIVAAGRRGGRGGARADVRRQPEAA
jgi:apolipoprotein N-acyltransferase